MIKHLYRFPIAILRHIRLTLFLLLLFSLIPSSTININNQHYAIAFHISEHNFDYISWELNAIGDKIGQTLFGMHPYLSPEDGSQYVRDYMADLAHAKQLEAEITQIYIDPAIDDPDTASSILQAERDALRESLVRQQLTAEAILEGQVATVLVEEGFGVAGQLFPPMSMHFTEVPNLLIVSPRDEIRFDISLNLVPLAVDEVTDIETFLDDTYDVSSLIVPLGGIALYPAMILETTSISYAVEVFAHEWAHHYLFFYPLGLTYFTGGDGFASEARTINETTADLFGKVIAEKVLARYYPDLTPPRLPEPVDPDAAVTETITEPDPDRFDFGATMNETRITVDELIAEGKVDEAEAYMESQRELFVANGYNIRKLNQAYFAFFGGYQSGDIPGIGGSDPIGPNVQAALYASPTAIDFLLTMRSVTSRDDLVKLVERLNNTNG
jgi:hypothetical protein